MAEVVLGLASSHTPQLSTSADFWTEHGARDRRNTRLLGPDGRYRGYDELLAGAEPALSAELEPAVWRSKFDRAQAAVGLGHAFTQHLLPAERAAARPVLAAGPGAARRDRPSSSASRTTSGLNARSRARAGSAPTACWTEL
jgi:hypothetical protein